MIQIGHLIKKRGEGKDMIADLIKDDERVYEHLGGTGKLDKDGNYVPILWEDMKNGKLPSIESGRWYWNTHEDAPCYLDGDEVYCFSYDPVGEFYLLGTLEELEEEIKNRIVLGFWGKERFRYLRDYAYGTMFSMICDGTLMQSCKDVELEADERQAQMIFQRMRKYESLKDTDPLEYNRIYNNEMAGVREVIRAELICV